MVIQMVPAHCCIAIGGNEHADALTKEGAGKTSEDASVTYQKTPKAKWQLQHPGRCQLRTLHNRFRHHLLPKLGIGQTSECRYGQGDHDNKTHPPELFHV
jgi:hypothetical protein